jgi:shikimate dehydrogenase
MRVFGLIGNPLGHSFSKQYFTEKFMSECVHDAVYEAFALPSISLLPALLHTQPHLAGLNVTIPYKQAVISYLHDATHLPFAACNCIALRQGRLVGFNTDHVGFEKSLMTVWQPWQVKALVLGNGGATLAVLHVLKKLGIEATIVGRAMGAGAHTTYAALTEREVARHFLIINCTPLGTFPDVDACPPIPFAGIGPEHLLFDLVYNPALSLFLARGAAAGAAVQNGKDMLVFQAEAAWAIWNHA